MQAMATAQPGDVTNPAALKGKRCTVGGVAFRVYAVRPGDVAIRFDLCDPNESK
jgi:cytochrome c-type biogenesis protein CcmE